MEMYSIVLTALTVFSLCEVFEQRQTLNGVIVKFGNQRLTFNGKKILIVMIVLAFMLISAMRDTSVGKDLSNYIPRYIYMGSVDWKNLFSLARSYSFEYGFVVFCKVLYLINSDPAFFLIITSIIISVGFYNLSRLSKMPILTMFIIFAFGFYGSSMNIIRQFLAFSILTFGIKYITDRKIWKFILTVTIATMFHTMAILFVPLFILYTIRFNRSSLISVIFISIFTAFFGDKIIEVIIKRSSFGWYLSRMGIGSGESTLLFLTVILLAVYVYRNKIMEIDLQDNLCMWGLSIAIICNTAALNFGILARVMTFFTPFISVLIPNLLYAMKKKDEINKYLYIFVGLLVIVFFLFYYQVVLMGAEAEGRGGGWFPYIWRS